MLIRNYCNYRLGECKVGDVVEIQGIKDLQHVTNLTDFKNDMRFLANWLWAWLCPKYAVPYCAVRSSRIIK